MLNSVTFKNHNQQTSTVHLQFNQRHTLVNCSNHQVVDTLFERLRSYRPIYEGVESGVIEYNSAKFCIDRKIKRVWSIYDYMLRPEETQRLSWVSIKEGVSFLHLIVPSVKVEQNDNQTMITLAGRPPQRVETLGSTFCKHIMFASLANRLLAGYEDVDTLMLCDDYGFLESERVVLNRFMYEFPRVQFITRHHMPNELYQWFVGCNREVIDL